MRKHTIWFTADPHFGHDNIRKYCQRPFTSSHEMNKALTENWNAVVRPKDEIYILGDFTFRDHIRYARRLNGRKYLILGNHDNRQDALAACDEELFEWVRDYYELRVNRQSFILFHYAMRQWNKKHHGSIHLYGHSHGCLKPHGLSFDVGVDAWNYTPISLDMVLDRAKLLTPDLTHH